MVMAWLRGVLAMSVGFALAIIGVATIAAWTSPIDTLQFWAIRGSETHRVLLDTRQGLVTTLDARPSRGKLSPDGQSVLRMTTAQGGTRIFTSSVNQPETMLGVYNIQNGGTFIGWSPDGERVVGIDAYQTDPTLYEIELETGYYQQRQVFDDRSVLSIDQSPDYRYLILRSEITSFQDGLLIDLQTGKTTLVANASFYRWSPDGTKLAYISQASPLFSTDSYQNELQVMDLTTFEVIVTLSLEKRVIAPIAPVWSADSEALLLTVFADESGIYAYDLASAQLHLVMDGGASVRFWSPDGRHLIVHQPLSTNREQVILVDFVDDRQTILYEGETLQPHEQVAWSDDFVALDYMPSALNGDRIFAVFDRRTGERQTQHHIPVRDFFPVVTSDGQYMRVSWWGR